MRSSLERIVSSFVGFAVRLVRTLMLFDFAQDVRLFGAPLTALLIEKACEIVPWSLSTYMASRRCWSL